MRYSPDTQPLTGQLLDVFFHRHLQKIRHGIPPYVKYEEYTHFYFSKEVHFGCSLTVRPPKDFRKFTRIGQ